MNRRACLLLLAISLGLIRAAAAAEDIAANERAAAAACMAFAEAEEIYHRTDYDLDGVLEYAQSIRGGSRAPVQALDTAALPKPSDEERQKIEKLIADCGNDAFDAREKAGRELLTMGPKAYTQVSAAVKTQRDPEIVQRCMKTARQIMESLAPAQSPTLQYGLPGAPEQWVPRSKTAVSSCSLLRLSNWESVRHSHGQPTAGCPWHTHAAPCTQPTPFMKPGSVIWSSRARALIF